MSDASRTAVATYSSGEWAVRHSRPAERTRVRHREYCLCGSCAQARFEVLLPIRHPERRFHVQVNSVKLVNAKRLDPASRHINVRVVCFVMVPV